MRLSRIYQPNVLEINQDLVLSSDASHYVSRVLRLRVNDFVTIFNGFGGEFRARIISIERDRVIVNIAQYFARELESPLTIYLGVTVSSVEKMDYTVQKIVELGVVRFSPILTERCQVKLSEQRWMKRLQHWRSISISACQQSGRNRLPLITQPFSLLQWVRTIQADVKYMLHPGGCRLVKPKKVNTMGLLIGPEGGWSETECELARAQQFGLLNLGPRILRMETAAVAAVAIFQNLFGDMTINDYA
jgi:16S rRNA (uracil1498-N3)-methyltransferase